MKVRTYVTIGPTHGHWSITHNGATVRSGISPSLGFVHAMDGIEELGLTADAVLVCNGDRFHLMSRTPSGFYETRAYGKRLIIHWHPDHTNTLEVRE